MTCFSSRLRVVRDVSFDNSKIFSFVNSFDLTSFEKFLIVLNLGFNFYFYNYFPFFVSKKRGLSFFFEVPYIFVNSLNSLCNLVTLPLLEVVTDKSSIFYRPFRDSYDLVKEFRKILSFKLSSFWFSSFQVSKVSLFSFWLLKSFPFDKKLLYFFVVNRSGFNDYFFNSFAFNKNSFFNSIWGFMLCGLVFIVKPKFSLFLRDYVLVFIF